MTQLDYQHIILRRFMVLRLAVDSFGFHDVTRSLEERTIVTILRQYSPIEGGPLQLDGYRA